MEIEPINLDQVLVGERIRRGPGSLERLKESIRRIGLLQPIVLNARGELIAGYRRLEAFRELRAEAPDDYRTIPAVHCRTFDELAAALQAERDENVEREPFTPGEMVEAARRIEAAIQEQVAEDSRRKQSEAAQKIGKGRGKSDSSVGNADQPKPPRNKTEDQVAAAVGTSAKTLRKAKAVVASGDAEAIAEMNRTGKVDPAYRKVRPSPATDEAADEDDADEGNAAETADAIGDDPAPVGETAPAGDAGLDATAAVAAFNAAYRQFCRAAETVVEAVAAEVGEVRGDWDRAFEAISELHDRLNARSRSR